MATKPFKVTIRENPGEGLAVMDIKAFLKGWAAGTINGTPVIEGAELGDISLDLEDAAHPLDIKFINCDIHKMDFYGGTVFIDATDSKMRGIHAECGTFGIKGKNVKIDGLDMGESRLTIGLDDSELINLTLYKTHVSGLMRGGKFEFDDGNRTYLGQNDALIMENVDFGGQKYNPEYFTNENMTLVNPKMNSAVLADVKKIRPESVRDGAPSNEDKAAMIQTANDKLKEKLLETGATFFVRTGMSALESEKLAGKIYDELAAKGKANMNNFSAELITASNRML